MVINNQQHLDKLNFRFLQKPLNMVEHNSKTTKCKWNSSSVLQRKSNIDPISSLTNDCDNHIDRKSTSQGPQICDLYHLIVFN